MKHTKKHGTPIYGDRYTDSNGVTLTWDSTLRRYVTAPEGDAAPAVPTPLQVIGTVTRYIGDEERHGGHGAKVKVTAVLLRKARLDAALIPDADPGTDRYTINDDDRLARLGGVQPCDSAEVHCWNERESRWGLVADEVDVADLELFKHLQEAVSSSGANDNGETMPAQPRPEAAGRRDDAHLRECLTVALDSIIEALSSVGATPVDLPLPIEGFDAALRDDADHQNTRAAFIKSYKSVFVVLPDDAARHRLLRLEESVNALSLSSATVAWRLALTVKGAARGKAK